MGSTPFALPARRAVIALLAIALVGFIAFDSSAHARTTHPASSSSGTRVRDGYFCGFETTYKLSSTQLADESITESGAGDEMVDHCSYYQNDHVVQVPAGNRTSLSWQLTTDDYHAYIQEFRYNHDPNTLYFNNAYFSSPYTNVSGEADQNGWSLRGTFVKPWFFSGTLKHKDNTTKYVYAWWVGDNCGALSDDVWSECMTALY